MAHLFNIILSAIIAFLLSLFFDGEMAKAVFATLGVVIFCTLYVRDFLYTIVRNQQLIFNQIREK